MRRHCVQNKSTLSSQAWTAAIRLIEKRTTLKSDSNRSRKVFNALNTGHVQGLDHQREPIEKLWESASYCLMSWISNSDPACSNIVFTINYDSWSIITDNLLVNEEKQIQGSVTGIASTVSGGGTLLYSADSQMDGKKIASSLSLEPLVVLHPPDQSHFSWCSLEPEHKPAGNRRNGH